MKKLFCLLTLLILVALSGYRPETAEQPTVLQRETQRTVSLTEIFLDCEHGYERSGETRSSAETKEELHDRFPEFDIVEFGEAHAKLIRYRRGKCDDHILFREYRGKIGVFRENNGALLDVVDVAVSSLRKQDQQMLKAGVSVFGKEEQAAFLDDFTI